MKNSRTCASLIPFIRILIRCVIRSSPLGLPSLTHATWCRSNTNSYDGYGWMESQSPMRCRCLRSLVPLFTPRKRPGNAPDSSDCCLSSLALLSASGCSSQGLSAAHHRRSHDWGGVSMMGVQPAALQKITARHLSRQGMLYVRQSTLHQVLENTESTARQYGLRERALALGWEASRIIVIDQDLGQSGASVVDRIGFQRLLSEVRLGHVGLVIHLEASRLARSSP